MEKEVGGIAAVWHKRKDRIITHCPAVAGFLFLLYLYLSAVKRFDGLLKSHPSPAYTGSTTDAASPSVLAHPIRKVLFVPRVRLIYLIKPWLVLHFRFLFSNDERPPEVVEPDARPDEGAPNVTQDTGVLQARRDMGPNELLVLLRQHRPVQAGVQVVDGVVSVVEGKIV